jgi:uncharacterized protein (TIGR03437 family)
MRHPFRLLLLILGLLPGWLLGQVDSTAAGPANHANVGRPLAVLQTRYRLRAGERVRIDVPSETADFIRSAKSRTAMPDGQRRAFAMGPNVAGDQILLGVPLTTSPGEYAVALSAINGSGEERMAKVSVTVDALPAVSANATTPPVVLLDGFQLPSLTSSCPMSSDSAGTFGNLANYLYGSPNAVPAVYFFENCTECPDCPIEELGAELGTFLNLLYSEGTPQVDVIAHSMGGLIVRSYLSGKQQASGAFTPPSVSKIRKAIFIATPHFGSFQADSATADILFSQGNQTNEMKRGSQFVWDLATWNQFGDDLRGTDALAVIGNAGSFENLPGASDGVVELTSGSLDFAKPGRTKIVDYCHVPTNSGIEETIEAGYIGCTGPGIAYIDSPSHQTYQIVSSFLLDNAAWQAIGTAPAQDPYLSKYGGMVVADLNSSDQYVSPPSVSFGSVALTTGAATELYYDDMVSGVGSFAFGSSNCGPYTQPIGVYSTARCKLAPIVYSVGPLSSAAGKIVQVGSTITITGSGFGQQCSGCQVLAVPPGYTTGYLLPVSSWTNQTISASFLPAAVPSVTLPGFVTIYVELSSSAWDSINIMAAAPASTIVLAPTSLRFSYTAGGTSPAAQSIQVTNNAGGTLNWSATTSASWLSVAPTSGTAPSTLSVQVSSTGLSAGTYTGSVQISAAGASNSPISVAVTLTVTPAAAVLAVSPQALTFNYTVGGAAPAAQGISITSTGGTLNWGATTSASWLSVAPASGTAPSTPSVRVSPTGLSAGTYTGDVQISASGSPNSSVPVTVTLTVAPAAAVLAISPQALTFNYAMGSATPAAQSVSINNSGGGTLAWTASSSASWLTVSPATGSTSSTLSVSMNPVGLIAGALSGAITISSPGIASQTLSVALTVTGAPLTPAIVSVVNAASFLPGFAPIGWVTITGKNLSVTSRTWTSSDIVNGQLPTSLDGVSVSINNHPAFVYYISPGQLNVQAPSDSLAADQNVQVTVTTPNGSASATALERRIGPAMFMSDATHVAAIHSDGTLVGPVGFIPGAASRPASPGETILLYMTGLGSDTSPVIPAGQIVTSPASMTDPINVMIGGQAAIVQYAGLVSPGLYQLNIVVPAVANGDQTATVQVAGVASENSGVVTVQQ